MDDESAEGRREVGRRSMNCVIGKKGKKRVRMEQGLVLDQ